MDMADHILFLIATLSIISVSADDFVSIDCGSSDAYTDKNLILWTGDDNYTQNGESHVVQTKSISPVMDTLRVFTTRKKNCYSIRANTGARVLVRASFYYGNYDSKSSPPTFDLLLDGNHWARVKTTNDGYVYYYEVTYTVKGDSISVCVAQTEKGQFPFVSAIEVRRLLNAMYDRVDQIYPLHLIKRVAYGANGTIRYADDPYDRIWRAVSENGLTTVKSEAFQFGVSFRDEPPPAVLKNAVTAVSYTATIQLSTGFPPVEAQAYFNMYFSEVTQLKATQKRSFHILLNDKPLLDWPIIPPYGNFTETRSYNYRVSSNTNLTLVPTNDSTLPPLINAMEVFLIGDAMADGTNRNDVEGLATLQNAFDVLQDWSGDPCLPAPFSWDWINCSNDPTPRVTALYLNSLNLSGKLPDFSSMDALQTIDFHNNSLEGPIPEFLGTLPNLKQLNLASNQFNGSVPDTLSKKNGLNLVVTGNPDLCTSGNSCKTADSSNPSSPTGGAKKKSNKLAVILGTIIVCLMNNSPFRCAFSNNFHFSCLI